MVCHEVAFFMHEISITPRIQLCIILLDVKTIVKNIEEKDMDGE
jgi:hypothetical protein